MANWWDEQFRLKDLEPHIRGLIENDEQPQAVRDLIASLPELAAGRFNPQEVLSQLLFVPRMAQNAGHTKYGFRKALRKSKSIAWKVRRHGGLASKQTFVEFGAGAHDPLAVSAVYYLNGFQRACGNDMQELRSEQFTAMSMYDLLANVALLPDEFALPGFKTDPDDISRRTRNFDAQALLDGRLDDGVQLNDGSIDHLVGDIVDMPLSDGEVSLLASFAVFEHVDDMAGVLSFLYDRTADDGIGFHYIDLADHRSYGKGRLEFNKYSMLTEDDSPGNVNRLRKSEHIDAFSAAGFEILEVTSRNEALPEAVASNLHPRFAAMSEDDQTAYTVTIITRKTR